MRYIFLTNIVSDHPFILLFCFLPALINFFIFLYVMFRMPRDTHNNYFAFFVLMLAFWQLSDACMHLCSTAETAMQMYRTSGVPTIGVAVFGLMFTLQFTQWNKKVPVIYSYLFIFIPAFILLMGMLAGLDGYTVQHSAVWNWVASPTPSIFINLFFSWISLVCIFGAILLFLYFIKVKKEDVSKKQALILFIGLIIPIAGGIIAEVINPLLLGIPSAPITVPLITIFSIASLVAIRRYRLFEYSPHHQWENILKTMNEGLLIVDNDDKIMYANEKFCEMTGFEIEELQTRTSASVLTDESKRLIQGNMPAEGKKSQYIVVLKRRNGSKMWAVVSSSAYTDAEGNRMGSIGILTDITDMIGIQNKLNNKINELNLFFYKTSHDLKSPIASMQGLLESYNKSDNPDELLNYMKICTAQLEKIVNRVSQLSVIQQKKLYTEQINSLEKVNKVLDELERELPFRHLLEVKINIDVTYIESEQFLLGLILKSLVENSIKYYDARQAAPFVSISIDRSGTDYKILVSDNGLGIDPSVQDRVFDMFYRGNDRSKGAGLGLYIVKAAAEKLGGKVGMKSEPGNGTAIKVILPVPGLVKDPKEHRLL